MEFNDVKVVRLYFKENEISISGLVRRLKNWEKLKGVVVFRSDLGYEDDKVVEGNTALEPPTNLPIVVEFFDHPEKVDQILGHLENEIEPRHVLTWNAKINR